MEQARKSFGTVNLRFVVPEPKRCSGCLELLTKVQCQGRLHGKIHTTPGSVVIKYRKRITQIHCPSCGATFRHTYYEVIMDPDGM